MIVLEGENYITYGIITSFIKADKNVVTVDSQLELKASGIIRNVNDNNVGNLKVAVCCY